MIIRRLIVPLTAAAVIVLAVQANAQGAFPAPLPGQAAAPANASPFPPVNGAAPATSFGQPSAFPSNGAAPITGPGVGAPPPQAGGGPTEACMKGFVPLREEAEKRGKMIKAASERHAQSDEACKLIGDYSKAEVKMIEYVRLNATKCGIPPQISEQLKKGHAGTEQMQKKVCSAAQAPRGPAGPSLSEVLGSSAALPEATTTAKKNGGTTFDTLNGNVLAR